jgi:hypothetical protein
MSKNIVIVKLSLFQPSQVSSMNNFINLPAHYDSMIKLISSFSKFFDISSSNSFTEKIDGRGLHFPHQHNYFLKYWQNKKFKILWILACELWNIRTCRAHSTNMQNKTLRYQVQIQSGIEDTNITK